MSAPPPVTVRLYGFVPMTRKRYVWQLVVAFGLALALLVAWWLRWPMFRAELKTMDTPSMRRFIFVWDMLPWVIVGFAIIQAIEARYVLRIFARKEAEAKAIPPTQ